MASITLTANKDAVMGRQIGGTGTGGWNGKDNHIQVGADDTHKYRGVIKFPLWLVPSFKSINSATLRLTQYSTESPHRVMDGSNTADLKIGRMTADWGEGAVDPGEGELTQTLDWNWSNRSTTYTNTKVYANFDQTTTGTELDVDITSIVNDWLVNDEANYGIILINNTSETDDAYAMLFYSEDAATAGNRPELIIDYEANNAPTDIINREPDDAETVNTLTPDFYGEMVDADGDDISAYEMFVTDSDDPTVSGTGGYMWYSGYQLTGGDVTASGNTISIPYGSGGTGLVVQPLQPGDTYYWKMRLYDTSEAGVTSSAYSFITNATPNAPTVVVTPTPLSAVPDSTPNFSITHNDPDPADTLMDGYTVIVEEESYAGAGDWTETWNTGDIDISGSPQSTVQITSTTLNWGVSYRVYARTQDSNGAWGAYSSPVGFTTLASGAPINLAPAGGETVPTATPILSGQKYSSDTITKFSIRVYTDDLQTAMLAETEYTSGTDGTIFSKLYAGTALTAGQTYRWSAKVYSDTGGYSAWSNWESFTVNNDATIPTITSPVGDGDYSLTPTITMTRASAFNTIEYEVYPQSSTTASLGSSHYASNTISQSSATSWSDSYPGTATLLEWATGYKIRGRVSSDGGSNWSSWSGLVWFSTESIDGPPVQVSIEGDTANPAWINTASPYFEISRYSGDANNIDKMQYRIWNASGTAYSYDSGMTDVTNATSAQLEYTAALLVPGTTYKWDARYQNAAGPYSPWSPLRAFRLNGPPDAPTGLFPPSDYVYLDAETKTFRADFSDPEEATFGDYPTDWEIYIHNEDTDSQHGSTQSVTSGLTAGENETTWTGTAFSSGVNYSWRSRFQDSLGEWGTWSAPSAFRVSTAPNGTITTPTNDSNITTVTPSVSWSITGDQERYTITIDRTDAEGVFVKRITTLEYFNTTTTSDSKVIPAGYMFDGKHYNLTLKIWNSDNLPDPSPSTVWVHVVLDAPDPILNVDGIADLTLSKMTLSWDQMSLKTGHTFVAYRIYRRRKYFTDWAEIGNVKSRSTLTYVDWYAGHGINYEYVVRAVTKKTAAGLELVSGDDPGGTSVITAQIASIDWHFIGKDRSPSHNSLLVIEDESHNRPIQQEVFETLGSSRKVIMRGFVLGHEGSITTLWFNTDVVAPEDEQLVINDTYRGRRIVDYLTRTAGPHIIKSPFGDVWDSQFATPQYQWLPTGHLQVQLEWIETGDTSEDDF